MAVKEKIALKYIHIRYKRAMRKFADSVLMQANELKDIAYFGAAIAKKMKAVDNEEEVQDIFEINDTDVNGYEAREYLFQTVPYLKSFRIKIDEEFLPGRKHNQAIEYEETENLDGDSWNVD